MDINLTFKIEKKHLILFSVFLVLILSIFTYSGTVNEYLPWHYVQQIAIGPADGGVNKMNSIDINKDGHVDIANNATYAFDADKLDGFNSSQIASKWNNSKVNHNNIFFVQGNVGIGTNDPQSELVVMGIIRAQQLCDESGANCVVLNQGIKSGLPSCSNGQVLKWNDGWTCGTDNEGSGGISSCSDCDSRFYRPGTQLPGFCTSTEVQAVVQCSMNGNCASCTCDGIGGASCTYNRG